VCHERVQSGLPERVPSGLPRVFVSGGGRVAVQRVDIIELEATGRATFPRRRGKLGPSWSFQRSMLSEIAQRHCGRVLGSSTWGTVYAGRPRDPGPHRAARCCRWMY
jgi:hypothetical protein